MTISIADAISAASRARTREPTEAQIQSAVIQHWRIFGLPNTLVASIPNAKAHGQSGLTKGLPDLLCIGPYGVGLIELKTRSGRPSKHQLHVLGICEMRGVLWEVTSGRDEPISVLEKWG